MHWLGGRGLREEAFVGFPDVLLLLRLAVEAREAGRWRGFLKDVGLGWSDRLGSIVSCAGEGTEDKD